MSKYLITGGCGFLGSNIAARLIRSGLPVVTFDNMSRVGAHENLKWLRELGLKEHVHGDLRQFDDVASVVRAHQPDAVFHLAGQVAMTTSLQRPRLDFETNALGTLNLLEAVRESVPQAAFLFSSTNKVYGDLTHHRHEETETRYVMPEFPGGLPETLPLEFQSPYGCSKGAADQYVLDYARMFGLNTVVFRHSSMYGGRQFATYDQGWIGWFCGQSLLQAQGRGEPFTVSGNGKQVRDVLHADDMADLYISAAALASTCRGQAFNIGGGVENSLSIIELLRFLESELSTKLRWVQMPPRASDQRFFVADITRARSALGWSPKIDWRSGVRKMLGWVRDNGCRL
ncbi:MAG: GDP-mannose 4,6-dehydratase [Verrucomicrobiae bacterium]|nr:GDP-mannose 4,6-dehydratase [Verrucomicrobiae bacterium]